MTSENTPADNTLLGKVAKTTLVVAGLALIGVAAVEGWQVFARYVLNKSPSWTEPLALLLMSTAMMCGAAAGVRGNHHFGFVMLSELAPPRVHKLLTLFSQLVAVAVGGIFLLAGAHLVSESWDFPMAGAALPQGVVYLPICIGGGLIALFGIERMLTSRQASSDDSGK